MNIIPAPVPSRSVRPDAFIGEPIQADLRRALRRLPVEVRPAIRDRVAELRATSTDRSTLVDAWTRAIGEASRRSTR